VENRVSPTGRCRDRVRLPIRRDEPFELDPRERERERETNVTGDIGTRANQIAPDKRMLSSMSPMIVTNNGKLFMVTGSQVAA